MLQEVHCSQENSHLWATEWGYKSLFSSFSSSKAGVSILFNNNFDLQIMKTYIDDSGRFILCDLKTNGKSITLTNIYAPNEDDPAFFKNLPDHLQDFEGDEIIIGGDFNLVLDVEKDKKGGLPKTHHNAQNTILEICDNLDLVDAWRILNPEEKRYTWRQTQPTVHCRLDFFLTSQSLLGNIISANILPGFKTNHSMITLNISLHSNPRGPGFWKLNTSLLADRDYIDLIRLTIHETQNEYENDESINPALLWDMIKLKTREKSLSFAAAKKRKTLQKQHELEEKIALLEKELEQLAAVSKTQKTNKTEQLELFKSELEEIIKVRTQGAILRCKIKWYNEGEKNTKYFLNLEKRHFKLSTISQLKITDQEFVTSDKEILAECETFYKKLYTSQKNVIPTENDLFQPENDTVLDNNDAMSCEGHLTEQECLKALRSMDREKTPGTDGLPAEFYRTFWKDLSPLLISALNYSYDEGSLSITQRRGIIKLISKKDAEPHLIKNWRPLTLLNCDYKIAAKAIANRIKSVIPKLINNDQTGFLKGRFIGENIRLIDNIINYASQKNIPGLLLFIDFEKAFDSLEWSFIERTLQYFGFGPSLISWFQTFYKNIESCVLNNGWASCFIQLQRGVRQGCPLSPYLFILSAEILAKAIRSNKNIKGISVNNSEIKISQYADDTTFILNGTSESLSATLQTIETFGSMSGLRLNSKKTEALWIGSMVGNKEKLFPEKNFKWPENKVKVLGVWLSIDPNITLNINYREKADKIKNILSNWKYRRLTLLGKIQVIKSLAASQLTYILAPLATNHKTIKEINDLFYSFLWDNKGDKIKRSVMINDYKNGGLKMVDIASFTKSLKTAWIKKYLDDSNCGKWKHFFELELRKYGGKLVFTSNLNKLDTSKLISVQDPFLQEILEIWSEVNFDDKIKTEQQFLEQHVWHNSLIRIENKPVFYKHLFLRGITKVTQFMMDSRSFLPLADFISTYNIRIQPIKYFGLISALRHHYNTNFLVKEPSSTDTPDTFSETFIKNDKANRVVYQKLLSSKSTVPFKSQEKWNDNIKSDERCFADWTSAYCLAARCTKSTKLVNFQFRFLHRILPTNLFLTKIDIKQDPNCSFCTNHPESLIHIFWNCTIVATFWENLTEKLKQVNLMSIDYSKHTAIYLGLRPDTSKFSLQLNFCFLLARYYIWCCRVSKKIPILTTFLVSLKSQFRIEFNNHDAVSKKWNPLLPLLNIT